MLFPLLRARVVPAGRQADQCPGDVKFGFGARFRPEPITGIKESTLREGNNLDRPFASIMRDGVRDFL